MKKLYDKIYRQSQIEHYLDAETSIEEEKALANFYRHCKAEDLTEEELGIRNLMLGLENYTQDSESDDMASETKAQTASKSVSRKSSSKTSSIRISALLLAAAMIAGLIFLVFPVKEMFSSKTALTSYAPASTVVRSYQSSIDESNESLNPAEEMERQDSLFLAATKDIVVPQAKEKARKVPKALHHIKSVKTPVQEHKRAASEEEEESLSNDFNHYYEVASLALPSADQLKIDKQGDHIIITTIDAEGNAQHFTIDTSDANEGMYQLHPLAQLNE